MSVWQASWDSVSGSLVLWGERQQPTQSPPPSTFVVREADAAGEHELRRHPSALTSAELSRELDRLEIDGFESATASLLLPTRDHRPLPSPSAFIGTNSDSGASAMSALSIESWTVECVRLPPLAALHFLSSLPEHLSQTATHSVIEVEHSVSADEAIPSERRCILLAPSLLLFVELTKLSLDLLSRGRFLPMLLREDEIFKARWRPVTTDEEDFRRITQLVSGLPLCCCALSDDDPTVTVLSFLQHATDSLCRYFLRRSDLCAGLSRSELRPNDQVGFDWLRSLNSPDGAVSGPPPIAARLEERLRLWGGVALAEQKKFPLRLLFRLHEPNEEGVWEIDFLIQSQCDYHHVVSAREFWRGELGFLKKTEHSWIEIEEVLLGGLGRAVQHFPELLRPLRESQPESVTLSLEEAFRFLKNASPSLENEGFGIELPQWWKSSSAKFGLELQISEGEEVAPQRARALGLNRLLDFSWQIALGEKTLTTAEFRSLVNEQAPLVRVDGHWVELPHDRMLATLQFLENHEKKAKLRVGEALRFQMGMHGSEELLPIVSFRASGWLQRFFDSENHMPEVIPQPALFQGSLRRYQLEGLSWFTFLSSLGIGGCLADDMGLGKTIQLLALLLREREVAKDDGLTVSPTLLVVPMSIIDNWYRETARFTPTLRIYVHHGIERLTGEAFQERAKKSDIVLTTYSLAHRDESDLAGVCWGRIALDEAQNIKNLNTKQTRSVRRIAQAQLEYCHRIALTGTPLENHLEELWSILDFLNPGMLGSLGDFRSRFSIPIERLRQKEAAQQLNQIVRPFILRRLKSDPRIITDLPSKIEMEEYITLTADQTALYQKVLDQMLPQVEQNSGVQRKGIVLSTITKLKQVCDHPALLGSPFTLSARSAKLDRLAELLEVMLEEGDRALIFTQFVQMGEILKGFVQERFGREALFLHGGLSRQARDALVTRFQSSDGPPVFILSLKAGGYGLNLTAANQVIHYDQWWNPATEQQATDRAYRIGQLKNVQVRRLLCQGTLEERIFELLKEKRALASEIVGTSANVLTELSTDELKKILTLSVNKLSNEGELENESGDPTVLNEDSMLTDEM